MTPPEEPNRGPIHLPLIGGVLQFLGVLLVLAINVLWIDRRLNDSRIAEFLVKWLWNDIDQEFVPMAVGVILFLLLCLFVAPRMIRFGGRLRQPNGQALLRRDGRPCVLYLRSHLDDHSRSFVRAVAEQRPWYLQIGPVPYLERTDTDEEELCNLLSRLGPTIALRRPGERLPALGAARIDVPLDQWQTTVEDFMCRAGLVVIRVSDSGLSPGLRWEVETARQLVRPTRLLFFIPIATRALAAGEGGNSVRDLFAWPDMRRELEHALKCRLPQRLGNSIFLCFTDSWHPVLIGSERTSLFDAFDTVCRLIKPS